jgi:hypothetical protein
VSICRNVTSIGAKAFHNCSRLVKVVIGIGVTDVYEAAFKDCKSLEVVIIGSGPRIQFHPQSLSNAVKLRDLIIWTVDQIVFDDSALKGSLVSMKLEIRKSLRKFVGTPSFLSDRYDCNGRYCRCRKGSGSTIDKLDFFNCENKCEIKLPGKRCSRQMHEAKVLV